MLGDLLRGTALDADAARLVVGRLVSLTVNEPVTKVRESALNSISEAFNHHRLPLDLVEPLDTDVPTMEPELLAHAVYIFDATHNPQARHLIEPSSTTPTLTWARKPAAQQPRSLNPIQKAAPTSLDDCSR